MSSNFRTQSTAAPEIICSEYEMVLLKVEVTELTLQTIAANKTAYRVVRSTFVDADVAVELTKSPMCFITGVLLTFSREVRDTRNNHVSVLEAPCGQVILPNSYNLAIIEHLALGILPPPGFEWLEPFTESIERVAATKGLYSSWINEIQYNPETAEVYLEMTMAELLKQEYEESLEAKKRESFGNNKQCSITPTGEPRFQFAGTQPFTEFGSSQPNIA
jgi:hypothetical protein